MNTTPNSNSGDVGTFPYIIGISVGILVLLTTLTIATYLCTRTPTRPPSRRRPRPVHRPDFVVEFGPPGLEDDAINGYPKIPYSEAKLDGKLESAAASGCSICLGDYRNGDELRLLPDCRHLFHVGCIDPWLRLNPSCPVCRTSPAPTPISTPLAEVVPFAVGRS